MLTVGELPGTGFNRSRRPFIVPDHGKSPKRLALFASENVKVCHWPSPRCCNELLKLIPPFSVLTVVFADRPLVQVMAPACSALEALMRNETDVYLLVSIVFAGRNPSRPISSAPG